MRLSGPGFLLDVPVLGGLFTLVTVVILARVGGRLLGIRLRWRRAILAGFPGLVLGWIAAWSINGQRCGPQALPWPAVLVGALVTTMLIAVLLDLLARPGPARGLLRHIGHRREVQLAGNRSPRPETPQPAVPPSPGTTSKKTPTSASSPALLRFLGPAATPAT